MLEFGAGDFINPLLLSAKIFSPVKCFSEK
jgi:hypothetical protein